MPEAAENVDDLDEQQQQEEQPAGDPPEGEENADDLAVEVQHNGQTVKMAPVHRVIENRQAARAAKVRAETAERENADLKEKLKQSGADFEKLTPLLRALKDRPELVEAAMRGTKPSSTANPVNHDADPAMVELARSMDLFDADGKPDAARAARISAQFKADAKREAEAEIAPLKHAQVQQRADANRHILYEWAKQGHVTKEGVDKAIAMMPGGEQLLAHDGVRDVLYFMARGMTPTAAKQAVAAAGGDTGAMHTETAGGRGKGPTSLPSFSKKIAERRGKTEAQWSKIRDNDSDELE